MTLDANMFLEPGQFVSHPDCPEWGIGQVQSNQSGRVTVNFPDAGKRVFAAGSISLKLEHYSHDAT